MSGLITSLGVKNEVTYGTPVVPNRFYEYNSEGLGLNAPAWQSSGLRYGGFVQREDRTRNFIRGVDPGDVVIEVGSKNFGWWLQHMVGSVASSGPTDSAYTHTGTLGSLNGKFFTLQANKSDNSETDHAFTYPGSKVVGWQLQQAVGEGLLFVPSISAQDERTDVSYTSASYVTGVDLFGSSDCIVSIGGTPFGVATGVTVTCAQNFKDDRHFLNASKLKKEPIQQGFREFTIQIPGEYDGLTSIYNYYAASTPSGRRAAIALTWTGPTLIGTSTYPSLTVTFPSARADGDSPQVGGPDVIDLNPTFTAMAPTGGASAITLAYVTTDSTP